MNNEILTAIKNNGLTVLPDTPQWINRFEIKSETSNRIYVIAQRANLREWGCSCPAWKRYRHCKHLDSISHLLPKSTNSQLKTLKNE